MGVIGAKVVDSPDIDLTTWGWASGYYSTFGRIATDVIRESFESNPPELYLSAQYTDHGDRHPLDIDMEVPLGEDTDSTPRWRFNLQDLIADVIEWFADGDGYIRPLPDEHPAACVSEGRVATAQSMVTELRKLADELESRIKPDPRNTE